MNYLSQVYLASLLKDAMSKTLKPRLVVLSAESHRFSNLSAESLSGRSALVRARAAFDATSAYNDSKLLLLMFCLECNGRWRRSGVRAYATHPGNCVSTNLPRHWWAYRLIFALVRPFAKSPQQAAATPVLATFHPDLEDLSEDHPRYLNNCFPCYPSAVASDQVARDRAKLTEELLKEKVDGFKEL